jgi:hypothetical protein
MPLHSIAASYEVSETHSSLAPVSFSPVSTAITDEIGANDTSRSAANVRGSGATKDSRGRYSTLSPES